MEALRAHKLQQAADRVAAGDLWQGHNLVFCTKIGTEPDRHNVLCEFKKITKRAGIRMAGCPGSFGTRSSASCLTVG